MARIERVEALLIDWAQWVKGGGEGAGAGFSVINILHEDWSPPAPGRMPTMRVARPSSAPMMHRLIGALSQRLANTVVMAYCFRLPFVEQAARLGCSVSTVHARIDTVHRLLAAELESVAGR